MYLSILLLPANLFMLLTPTFSVDVNFWDSTVSISPPIDFMTCPSLAPGICCLSPIPVTGNIQARGVTFTHLHAAHIAAVWETRSRPGGRTTIRGCSGMVSDSRVGPGTWTVWNRFRRDARGFLRPTPMQVSGASYIEMSVALPPNARMSNWLGAQGVLGLV